MKIEKLDAYPPGSEFAVDLVIIGGGPAGLTIAREFSNSSITVLVLESGLEVEEAASMELNNLESNGEPQSPAALEFRAAFHGNNIASFDQDTQPFGIRCRVLGGSAIYWGGKSALFDQTDFSARDWVPNSGWPISRDHLEPYFDRAAEVLNLGPNLYDEKLWALINKRIERPPIDNTKLQSFFWQFARSSVDHTRVMSFADEFRAADSENIRTLTGATAVRLDTDVAGKKFAGVEVSTMGRAHSYVAAKACVLAAGSIENARLLLNSNHQHPCGLGNQHDVVGRYLMDHPGTRIGYFKKEDVWVAKFLGFYPVAHKGALFLYMHGLVFAPAYQAKEKLLNSAIYVLPEIAPDDPVEAIKRLLRFKSSSISSDLWSSLGGATLLVKGVGLMTIRSRFFPRMLQRLIVDLLTMIGPGFVVREFQSKGVPHKLKSLGIHVITEQEPDPESRVVLSDQTDALGMRKARATWKISEAERRSVVRIGQLMREELPKAGLPEPILDDWIVNDRPADGALVDMAHIIGTTRMSDDPKTGVVDTQCEVYGVEGLYIAGSSVFPTSGHANPTLMILSLALRVADHLKRILTQQVGKAAA